MGMKVLVVEDDYFIAEDLTQHLGALGVVVLGPAPDLETAERILSEGHSPDFALLDVHLSSQTVIPLAEQLAARGTRYAFVTGYDRDVVPVHLRGAPVLTKPFTPDALAGMLLGHGDELGLPAGSFANHLLQRLPSPTIEALRPHMSLVPLVPHRALVTADTATKRVYFPESGILSLVLGPRTAPVEVAHVGSEGVAGAWTLLDPLSPFDVIVHSPGFAIGIDVGRFLEVVAPSTAARDLLSTFQHVLSIQIACGAVANASDKLEARLARWLLMCADRIGPRLSVVHEFASLMLNVRRAGVTTAIHVLEGEHTIRAARSNIEIIDREKLKSLASSVYGVPERAYERLIGSREPNDPPAPHR